MSGLPLGAQLRQALLALREVIIARYYGKTEGVSWGLAYVANNSRLDSTEPQQFNTKVARDAQKHLASVRRELESLMDGTPRCMRNFAALRNAEELLGEYEAAVCLLQDDVTITLDAPPQHANCRCAVTPKEQP